LGRIHSSGSLYLYLLTANGGVYPVHPLSPPGENHRGVDDSLWIRDSGALLEEALEKTNQVHSAVLRSHPAERFKLTYSALASMAEQLSRSSGQKQLLWITYGIPSQIRFTGQGWVDLTPSLRQLAAQFTLADTMIYTLDPSLRFASLNRDGLDVLSAATGGRTFSSSDFAMALTQMRADAASSYLLAYDPPPNQDGKYNYRKVRVTCDRKDIQIRSQQVYLTER
jgi:VWFA-related protein